MVAATFVVLSMFSGIILDLPFPKCLWHRMTLREGDDLAGETWEPTLGDLAEIDDEIARGTTYRAFPTQPK